MDTATAFLGCGHVLGGVVLAAFSDNALLAAVQALGGLAILALGTVSK